MNKVLSIDAGKGQIGWAKFNENRYLWDAGLFKFGSLYELHQWVCLNSAHLIVVERMHWTRNRDVEPNDLLAVSEAVGACASVQPNTAIFKPHEWKGNQSKKDNHARIRRVLNWEEWEAIPKPANHNTLDAVGIGLFALRR